MRAGDLINLYISSVKYHGYSAQTARMMAVGTITPEQETTLEMCADAVRRAEKLIRPGVRFSDLHKAAFSAYIERGYLTRRHDGDDAVQLGIRWTTAAPAGADPSDTSRTRTTSARDAPAEPRVSGRWPARTTRISGHGVGTSGSPKFNVTSHNTDLAEPGMTFVLHAQWLDPLSSGANIGDCYLVTGTATRTSAATRRSRPSASRASGRDGG